MPPLLKYSNGWGHLIISVSTQIIAVILLVQNNPSYAGLGISLLVSVTASWHITSAAHSQQKIIEATQSRQVIVTPPASEVTVTSGGLTNGNTHT